ncbi:hypothetical protein SLS63_008198 [Diaporthe eres]|uniref:RBR-type E3 ubiquitin transferase n=1 Tax=Diaporthe eres TaxID=83184 RepID=A0ABR1P3A1_DIAER
MNTRSLIIKMLRQDLAEAMIKMKGRSGRFDYDRKVAIDVHLAELEAQTAFLTDRIMAQSIVQAVHHDDNIIAAAIAQERQAESDRQTALLLENQDRLPENAQRPQPNEEANIDDELRGRLEAQYNLPTHGDGNDICSPDSPNIHIPLRPKKVRPCLICTESFPVNDLARLPCSHEYCRACLRNLFTSSLTDETLFPARCCRQKIPEMEPQIQIILGGQLLSRYMAKKVEMETPNKTYCHRPDCSTFIPPQSIENDIANCPKCQNKTCSICKAAAHEGTDCPKDEAAQQLLDLAKQQGWRQCHACKKVIELKYGCNHIIWKDKGQRGACTCQLFDEDTLLRQAARDAARDRRFHQQLPARQRQIVQQRRERIVRNHACEHADWTSKRGVFTCHRCSEVMPKYIWECTGCDLEVCHRCKRNRLR